MVLSCSEALVHRVGDGDENGLKEEAGSASVAAVFPPTGIIYVEISRDRRQTHRHDRQRDSGSRAGRHV